ncbi:MAG: chain length-determining protein [Gammaproteobacteria bacterium]|nr:chain length-determining protein [Gammaproteobacteria bacterium]
MFEQLLAVRTILRMAWLYRWVGLASTIVVCALGWGTVLLLPDQFRVTAKIYLDSGSMLRPLLQGIAFNSSSLADTSLLLSRTLLTRPNLESVARRTDLDLATKTPEDFDRLISGLAKDITIQGTREDNIYEIKYSNAVPKAAKAVVDELLNTFMESALGDTRRETAGAQKFLDEQIASYEQRLLEAEDRLKQFKQRNVGVMPGSQGDYFSRLEAAQNQLREAQLELREAVNSRDELKAQMQDQAESIVDESAAGGMATDGPLSLFDTKIQGLQERIDDLLLNFTDKHPDVVGLRKMIAEVETKRTAQQAAITRSAAEAVETGELGPRLGSSANPFWQQLEVATLQADAQVAALQTRVGEYETRLKELAQKVDTVPQVEAELARLNRDYAVNKTQYDELLQRREQARLSQEADQSEDDVKIKILEPPRVPLIATGPPRLLLASGVLVIGLGFGGALCLALSQLRPCIIDVPDLVDLTGLTVLGVISLSASPLYRQARRVELYAFSGGLAGLLLVYAGQITLLLLDVNLHQKLQSAIGRLL